jgi:hypothetical protein
MSKARRLQWCVIGYRTHYLLLVVFKITIGGKVEVTWKIQIDMRSSREKDE